MRLLQRIYSTTFWTFLAVTLIPFFCVGLVVFLVTRPFDPNGRVQHLYSCFWAQTYMYVNPFWRQRFEGRSKLPWKGPAVLVANHESLGDILVLFGLYRPYKWVSKASVFKVPFLGWNMKLNRYVGIVRGKKESILKMMKECRGWLDRGVPVLLFPEGTRSPDGDVQAFKDGAFRLAVEAGCPVIPIVLTGTANTLPKHGFLLKHRADVHVRVLDPIDPAPYGGDFERLREDVRATMIAEKARMLGQAVPGAEAAPPAKKAARSSQELHA